jgi:hypothetical protein
VDERCKKGTRIRSDEGEGETGRKAGAAGLRGEASRQPSYPRKVTVVHENEAVVHGVLVFLGLVVPSECPTKTLAKVQTLRFTRGKLFARVKMVQTMAFRL